MVTRKGTRSYIVYRRWGGRRAPSRRTIGRCDRITLAAARDQARHWLEAAGRGEDPREELRKAQRAAQRAQQTTFQAVVEAWLASAEVQATRTRDEAARVMRAEFIPLWSEWPIAEIQAADIAAAIRAKAETAPSHARNLLGYLKRAFGWAEAQHLYDLTNNPAAALKPDKLCGKKVTRKRTLNDAELRALWQASGEIAYPFGPLTRLLILTGQRRSDVAEAPWSEFDLDKKLWTITAERYKTEAPHVVPLTSEAVDILQGLPRFASGDHVFTTTFGKRPVSGFGAMKRRLDSLLAGKMTAPWRLHDIRRTLRTNLSALPGVTDMVKELVIGHAQPGVIPGYDQYSYLDEKRIALERWAKRLHAIVGRT
jgi:integrase